MWINQLDNTALDGNSTVKCVNMRKCLSIKDLRITVIATPCNGSLAIQGSPYAKARKYSRTRNNLACFAARCRRAAAFRAGLVPFCRRQIATPYIEPQHVPKG
jgi:hypothetical protein